jgi:GNAT superfamily N-acetyltransferase
MGITYREYDFLAEGSERLFELFAACYGDPEALRERWEWQYEQHPQKHDIKMVIVEDEGKLVGMTSFFPIHFLNKGEKLPAWHGATAMVLPQYRRRGISTVITRMFADLLPVLIGKGIAPKQYEVVIKFGWKIIHPNTYMLRVLSIPKWILRKVKLYSRGGKFLEPGEGFDEQYEIVERYGSEFDEFWDRVAPHYPCIVAKDSAYMNWRYVDIPMKKYLSLYRKTNGVVSSVIVLRAAGHLGNIVDMIWDPRDESEPDSVTRFTSRYLKKSGFTNSCAFATLREFKRCLKRRGYMDLKASPLLCVYAEPDVMARLSDGNTIHFVDGDSDHEFL